MDEQDQQHKSDVELLLQRHLRRISVRLLFLLLGLPKFVFVIELRVSTRLSHSSRDRGRRLSFRLSSSLIATSSNMSESFETLPELDVQ